MYRHLGTMIAEFVRLPDLTRASAEAAVDWQGALQRIEGLLGEGKGLIFATGHIGNWEASGAIFQLMGISAGAIARPLDNPLLDTYINGIRQATGQEIWDKFGAMRSVLRVLRKGEPFGILVDQDAGKRGVFAPFFGIEASTIPTVADLAIRTGAPILVAGMHRAAEPMRYRLTVCDPLRVDPANDATAERERLLREMNAQLETVIRRHPEQWLWLHRRWKTRPTPTPEEG